MARPGRPPRDDLAFVRDVLARRDDEAGEEIGYVARVFAQTSLPYKNPGDDLPVWRRRNGALTLSVQPGAPLLDAAGNEILSGYPYGTLPRLLLAWLGTEAVRRQERVVPLGDSLADFCRQVGLIASGGANGPITRLRDQAQRLLRARISVDYAETVGETQRHRARFLQVADAYDLWWSDRAPGQATLLPSYVELSQQFYDEIVSRPVPVDMWALRALKGAPLRLDLYIWLTYRLSYLRQPTVISWDQLRAQFGTQATTPAAKAKFRTDLLAHLSRVLAVYPDARVEDLPTGLRLLPSRPSISRNGRPSLSSF